MSEVLSMGFVSPAISMSMSRACGMFFASVKSLSGLPEIVMPVSMKDRVSDSVRVLPSIALV